MDQPLLDRKKLDTGYDGRALPYDDRGVQIGVAEEELALPLLSYSTVSFADNSHLAHPPLPLRDLHASCLGIPPTG